MDQSVFPFLIYLLNLFKKTGYLNVAPVAIIPTCSIDLLTDISQSTSLLLTCNHTVSYQFSLSISFIQISIMCLKKKSPQLDCSIVLSLDYIYLSKNGDKERKKKKKEKQKGNAGTSVKHTLIMSSPLQTVRWTRQFKKAPKMF